VDPAPAFSLTVDRGSGPSGTRQAKPARWRVPTIRSAGGCVHAGPLRPRDQLRTADWARTRSGYG